MSQTNTAFGKTICSICYEDLKPLIEDLQSISICGHVFHELCLQQWLEYCNAKKCTCPVCKQKCTQENVCRLYFQSIGETNDTQKPIGEAERGVLREEDDPVFLLREVNKFKGKLSVVNAAFESQEKNLKEVNDELGVCKEQLKRELALKNEALTQKSVLKRSFQLKSEELVKSTAECLRLQERSMALAKELAALKLVSDLNLEEEQVANLASIGNESNSNATADVLAKSLVLRNKTYNKLMAQYNLVSRGESRALKKYEKAKEKMKKLKARVIELELASEERDNAALRALKASKAPEKLDAPQITKFPPANQAKLSPEPAIKPNQINGLGGHSILFRKTGTVDFHKELGLNSSTNDKNVVDVDLDSSTKVKNVVDVDLENDTSIGLDDINFDCPQPVHEQASTSKVQTDNCFNDDMDTTVTDNMDDNVVHVDNPDESSGDDIVEIPPFQIRKEASNTVPASNPVPAPKPGDDCFSGGLTGPDGGNWFLGKWCKRPLNKSASMHGSTTGTGDIVSVGADGRGGRVKVLRSSNQIDVKGSSALSKKGKNGSKQSSQQPKGFLQIDHFFAKENRS